MRKWASSPCRCGGAGSGRAPHPSRTDGITLIELVVVLALIAIAVAVIYPRISGLEEARLESDARKMASLIGYLSESAASRRVYYKVRFGLDEERLDVEVSRDGREYLRDKEFGFLSLSSGVSMEDVATPEGKTDAGETEIVIPPDGGSSPFSVHLKAGDEFMTVTFNPYTEKVSLEKGYS
ncbi:MAG: prepilin-type N-terminal cleavage/methylation domain-containing protein [Deltaproteobacteria bacterium]|nr:prepilin-type N-terminal cleavage/methylation domain-containing protein [Deltaproteobacteria bacterium]